MNLRFALAVALILCIDVTLTASTTYGFGSITGNNAPNGMSLDSEPTPYQTGTTQPFWTEAFFGGTGTTEQIVCVVALATTGHICGDPGPGSSVNIGIPAAPGLSSILGTTNYLMVDGDPEWGAPVWTDMTGLTVGSTYQLSFYQATSEENGNTKEYDDSWEVYILPGASTGAYLCPESYCASISTQTSIDSSDLAYTSPVIDNTGAVSTNWELESFTFQATNASEILEFVTQAVATTAGAFMPPLLALADVTLSQTTPEPGTWVMTILGVGAVFGVGRLRRRFSSRG